MKINYALTLLSCLYTFVRCVEYLQSGITLAIQKDISQSITKDFWDSFSKNLKNTTFCDKKGCPIDHSEDKQIIGIQSNITIFNMKFKDINFTQADHMMVLIESSQTIKIVIDKFYFKVGFDFDANSTIFSDSGNGTFSNNMTITLAITPTYCSETGKLKIHFNSIVVNNAPNQEAYKFELNAKTFPIMQVQENIERWRGFIITKMNELLKIFQQDIENYINQFFGNKIYSFTNRTIEQYTSCNLTAKSDIQLCPLAIPIRYVNDRIEASPVCICENLIDYKEKTYNPSIREDFISTRFYAMTFSPNKTNGERPNLINSTDLVYMPTYESDKKAMIIQMFISQAFINSFISSYADRGVLNQILVSKSNNILDNSCYNIIYMLYPKPKGDCRLNIYLEKVSEIKITAGQLYQNSTTFKFEFVDPTENKTYAIAHFEFCSWSSFRMKGNFTIENINLGNPTEDYNITCFSSQSDYGDLKDCKQITNGFSKAINAYLAKYPTFNIYEAFFKGKDKLKYLNIAFNETEFNLIDRYISLYSKPDFSQLLKFLQQAFCNESWAKSGEYWFWKVVCINYEPMEPSLINHEAFMQRLLNPKEKPNIESRKQTNRRSHLYPRDPRFRTDIL